MALPVLIGSFLSRHVLSQAAILGAGRAGAASRAGGMAAAQAGGAPTKQSLALLKQMSAQWLVFNARLHHGTGLLTGWTSAYVGHLNAVTNAIGHMAEPVKALVALANPARAQMFELAMMDAHAVVGRMLIPVMDAFTRTARRWGDTMAGFEPVMEPANKALANMVDSIGVGLRDAAIKAEPAIVLLTDAIVVMADSAGQAALYMGAVSEALLAGLKYLRPGTRHFDPNRTSMGAAVRETRFVGAKDIANEAIKNALMLGAGVDKEKTTEGLLENIWNWLQNEAPKLAEQARQAGVQPRASAEDDPFDFWRRQMTGRFS